MCALPESVDSIRERHYRTCLLLLSAIGLWPFGNRTVRRIKYITISYTFLGNVLFAQFRAFKTVAYTFDLFFKSVSQILVSLAVMVKYFSFYLIRKHIKRLIEALQYDWRELNNQEELDIIEKYAMRGNFQTKVLSVIVGLCTLFLSLSPFTSIFLDLIMPLNESRPYQFPLIFETILDQQEYFCFNAVLFAASAIISAISVLGTDCMLFMFCQHACGLFAITSHRFLIAFSEMNLKHEKSGETTYTVIEDAVRMHVRAASFVESLSSLFGWCYFILLFLGISALSISLYRMTSTILLCNDVIEIMTSVFFAIGILEYMFFMNYICQELTDQSANVFTTLCSTSWYEAPLSAQRLLLFILLRSVKPGRININGFFCPSIQGFSSITQMSLSYFMVLFSIQ